MSAQLNRIAARGFAEANLSTLSADLIAWRKTGNLSCDRKFHELAKLCAPFSSDGDEYQEAERMIVTFALEHASRVDAMRAQLESHRVFFDRLRTHLIAHNALADFGPELFKIINSNAPV